MNSNDLHRQLNPLYCTEKFPINLPFLKSNIYYACVIVCWLVGPLVLCLSQNQNLDCQIGSDMKDSRDIYGIEETCQTWLWCLCMCMQAFMHTPASMHTNHFLACLGPYLSQILSDQWDQGIYGIGGTCWSWLWCLCICMQALTHASMHVYRPISQPNFVRSEISRHLWKQVNMLELSMQIRWPKHTI